MTAGSGDIQITRITPDTFFIPGQSPQQGYRIEFTSPSGVRSHVIVPRSEQLETDVKAAVESESSRIETVLTQPYQST